MTDTTVSPVPSLALSVIRACVQKGLVSLATLLLANGFITSDQQAQFVSIGAGIVMGLVSLAWTYLHESHAKARVVAALNASPPGHG